MTDIVTTPKDQAERQETLAFIECHQAGILMGDYQISVAQRVTTAKPLKTDGTEADAKEANQVFSNSNYFSIAGPRFELSPGDIHAQFPPANSRGDYANVLPHMALTRSTLPWEREIWAGTQAGKGNPPWLALLVIHEDEKQADQVLPIKTRTLKELRTDEPNGKTWFLNQNLDETTTETSCKIWFPSFTLEKAQQEDDKVTVLDIRKDLLTALLPTVDDLALLAHVRQQTSHSLDANQPEVELASELAVVISNRLPLSGGSTTMYLVSLEDRFHQDGRFHCVSCSNDDYIRLVCLKSYEFSCLEPKYSFRGLLTHLDQATLRLPAKGINDPLEPYLAQGYVPLPHHFRRGDRKISWYHGPLVPWQNASSQDATSLTKRRPRVADQLLRYNEQTGLLDTSYASAWELGRLLSLQDKRLSLGLFNWKQACLQAARKKQQSRSDHHLRVDAYAEQLPVPQEINDWFQQLSLLQGVPFNYLVPDDRLLPPESIRLFWIDPLWIDCLLDGAFSIGRVTAANSVQDSPDQVIDDRNEQRERKQPITGCLLHSEVVAGFPDLMIDGYHLAVSDDNRDSPNLPSKNKLSILRRERLSDHTLICLFDGEVNAIDLSLKPEALHFGLTVDENDGALPAAHQATPSEEENGAKNNTVFIPPGSTQSLGQRDFHKNLKNNKGQELKDNSGQKALNQKIKISCKQERLSLNMTQLAQSMETILGERTFTSAQFALQMVEGIDKVRFTLDPYSAL